jgi:hypothetical protein
MCRPTGRHTVPHHRRVQLGAVESPRVGHKAVGAQAAARACDCVVRVVEVRQPKAMRYFVHIDADPRHLGARQAPKRRRNLGTGTVADVWATMEQNAIGDARPV